jgi:thioredoxin-like negative regulator of GroEL
MPFLFLLLAAGLLSLAACTAQVQGGRAMARGDYPEAVAAFRQALAQCPDSLETRRRLAAALVHAGDAPGAAGVCEEVLEKAPGDPQATLYLGLALVMQGKRDEGFDRLASYRHWQAMREQQVVADAARRLRGHPELSPEELVAEMERALELGRVAELRERNSERPERK